MKARSVDLRAANAVLESLRELKEIDSRWNDRLIAMRLAPAAEAEKEAALGDPTRVDRVQSMLAVNAFNLGTSLNPQALADLKQAFNDKSAAVANLVAARRAFSAALEALVRASDALWALPRGSDGVGPQTERAAERVVSTTLGHLAQASPASARTAQEAAEALAAEDVPAPYVAEVQALAAAAKALLQARAAESLGSRRG